VTHSYWAVVQETGGKNEAIHHVKVYKKAFSGLQTLQQAWAGFEKNVRSVLMSIGEDQYRRNDSEVCWLNVATHRNSGVRSME
jgi:hypothetical protein